MNYIHEGIKRGIIAFDDEQKNISYHTAETKKRRYTDPEEKVQAETFCRLVLEYGYSAKRITINEKITMGGTIKEADIIVYNDDALTQAYIIVECKNEDVSEAEFQQAVKQVFSYAYAKEGNVQYVWATKGNRNESYLFDRSTNKKQRSSLPKFGEKEAPPFNFVKEKNYTRPLDKKQFELFDIAVVEENELTRIFKQCHDALWAGGELNPTQAFDELDKLIFCKIWDEKNTDKKQPYKFQVYSNETPEQLKDRINLLYEAGKKKDPEVFNKPIDLSAERIMTIVDYLQSINLSDTDLDSKGKAFETFMGKYFRGEFGQYFTPRVVVKMIIDVLPITSESKVLDTSCGSGGFLLYALDKVRQQANEKFDQNDPKEAVQYFTHWHSFAEKRLFGIEINESIARVAKMNMIIHDDGHTNVIAFDGLNAIDYIQSKTENKGFAADSFDFIVTNPPFGSIVKQSEKSYMQTDKSSAPYYDFSLKEVNWIDAAAKDKHLTTGRENQSTEILFIEQCYKFLKEDAYLAIVVPDGILTNSSLQYVRDSIEQKFRIVAVVSLPQTTFTHTGAGVKSSVLFLKKYPQNTTDNIKNSQDNLKEQVAKELKLTETYKKWEAEKREALKPLLKRKDEASQTQKDEINEQFNEKRDKLYNEIAEAYERRKQNVLSNYPIFMAIAENIGYDAAGKPTTQNDLPEITAELKRFIESIENYTDANFY